MAHILCIGRDSDLTDFLRYVLTNEGYTVLVTRTGDDALRMVRSNSFDLIIIDADQLDINGFEVASSPHSFSHAPIVVLVAGTQGEAVTSRFARGADRSIYISKPFNMQSLVQRVNAMLRQ